MEKIDWNHWLLMKTVTQWEAALLSLNIDPSCLKVSGLENGDPLLRFDNDTPLSSEQKSAFSKRVDEIENNQNLEGFACGSFHIDLNGFVDWMILKNQDLPSKLATLATVQTPSSKKYPSDWKDLVKEKTLEYCQGKRDISEKNASFHMEGYLVALYENGQIPAPKKAATIVKEVYSAEQWWARNIKNLSL
jgi:hypothetical protein